MSAVCCLYSVVYRPVKLWSMLGVLLVGDSNYTKIWIRPHTLGKLLAYVYSEALRRVCRSDVGVKLGVDVDAVQHRLLIGG